MDVAKNQAPSVFSRTKVRVGIALGIVALIVSLFVLTSRSAVAVDAQDLLIDRVQQGSLDITVEGYGQLSSAKQQLITAPSQVTVKEIVLKPGAKVTADSVIARLENPALDQQVESAKQALSQAQASLRQLKLNNQRETLKEQASLAELVAQLQTAAVQRQAEQKLVASGIVSKLSYEQTRQNERQFKQRVALTRKSIAQLNRLHAESVGIQMDRITEQQGLLATAQSLVDKLTVKAGIDGVLQQLPVEVGQSLNSGQEVALVGSTTDLIALVHVPQGQAQSVHIGDVAVVDTRREQIKGKVSRIDPIVSNNTVEVEVALPAGAGGRPNLSVDCSIIDQHLDHVTYVKRPAGVKAGSTATVYVMKGDSSTAQPAMVKFGRLAGQNIEVLSGVKVGERIIVSDLSSMKLDGKPLRVKAG